MEKTIFPEPGSPIRLSPDPPANAWHLHEAPEWETQCQDMSLFELVSFHVTELEVFRHYKQGQHNWKCCEWCRCANADECGYLDMATEIIQL